MHGPLSFVVKTSGSQILFVNLSGTESYHPVNWMGWALCWIIWLASEHWLYFLVRSVERQPLSLWFTMLTWVHFLTSISVSFLFQEDAKQLVLAALRSGGEHKPRTWNHNFHTCFNAKLALHPAGWFRRLVSWFLLRVFKFGLSCPESQPNYNVTLEKSSLPSGQY